MRPLQLPLNAIDTVSPAIEMTKRIMFSPFRFGRWWRMGLLAMATGEMFNSFSGDLRLPADMNRPSDANEFYFQEAGRNSLPWELLVPIVTALVVGAIVLFFVHMYVSSVLRFVMYDAVLTDQFQLLQGWGKWHRQGVRLFVFKLLVTFIVLTLVLLFFAAPLLALLTQIKAKGPEAVMGTLLSLLIFIPLLLLFALVAAIFNLLLKDFAALIMMFEDLSAWQALKRVFSLANHAKGDYAGYIGMKVVLSIGETIAMSIVAVILLLIVAIPVGVAIAAFSSGGDWAQILRDPLTLAAMITSAIVMLFFFLFVLAVIGSPLTVFFQSYVVNFFGSRYEPLKKIVFPQLASAPAPEVFGGVPSAPLMPPIDPGSTPSM